jgi:hypothetical protein
MWPPGGRINATTAPAPESTEIAAARIRRSTVERWLHWCAVLWHVQVGRTADLAKPFIKHGAHHEFSGSAM